MSSASTPTNPSIAVVIPNWNGKERLENCLAAATRQSVPSTVIVVDNGSTDDSVSYISKNFPNVIILEQSSNLGFAGGVNKGIAYALLHKISYVALLNNDAVPKNDWLEVMYNELLHQPQAGICTCLILDKNGELIDSTGEFYTNWGLPFPRSRGQKAPLADAAGKVFGASGGASLYRSILFQDVGYFDDIFFAYYEDTDISFRAQLRGWGVIYTPMAVVHHATGSTSRTIPGFNVKQAFRNLPILYLKNVPFGLLLPIGIRFFIAYNLMFFKAMLNTNRFAAVRGYFAAITLIPHALIARWHIQSTKKISAKAFNELLLHDLPPDQTGLRKLRSSFSLSRK